MKSKKLYELLLKKGPRCYPADAVKFDNQEGVLKMKTSELTGAALDWAVAKAMGFAFSYDPNFKPSDYWVQGGPIIEREGINIRAIRKEGYTLDGHWLAAYDHGNTGTMVRWVKRTDWRKHYSAGPTPLIAAMRCYVASKLGDEIEVPGELT